MIDKREKFRQEIRAEEAERRLQLAFYAGYSRGFTNRDHNLTVADMRKAWEEYLDE